MNKNLVFAAGAALMCLGAFDLYMGLAQPGIGEDAFASMAQSFMLLFPGSVFMAYSLQKTPRLTSIVVAQPVVVESPLEVQPPEPVAVSASSVVVPFPLRGGRNLGRKPAARSHSK